MNYDYDVIIVGAGPAGSTTALYAVQNNLKILLIDKAVFPRDKVCGDVIPGDCLPILQELNLFEQLIKSAQTSREMFFYFESDDLKFPHINDINNTANFVCQRFIFDNILFQNAKKFVDTHEGFKLTNLLMENKQVYGIEGVNAEGKYCKYTAKVIIGADGCSSTVAKKLGLNQKDIFHEAVANRTYYRHLSVPKDQLGFYYLSDCIPGYFWIFPMNNDCFNVGVILFSDGEKKSANAIYQQLKNTSFWQEKFQWGEVVNPTKGWYLPIGTKQRVIHGNGFILVGDAAGLIDPIFAHGIDAAMISGKIAGKILQNVCQGYDYTESALKIYADTVWQTFWKTYQYRYTFRQKWFTSSQYRQSFRSAIAKKNQVL